MPSKPSDVLSMRPPVGTPVRIVENRVDMPEVNMVGMEGVIVRLDIDNGVRIRVHEAFATRDRFLHAEGEQDYRKFYIYGYLTAEDQAGVFMDLGEFEVIADTDDNVALES